MENQHKEFSTFRSYFLGIPKDSSNGLEPVFYPRSSMTIHGSNFLDMKIKTILDLIENKQPKLILRAGKNYVIYEIDELGMRNFWGQFTPKPSPQRIAPPPQRRRSGLNDRISQYSDPVEAPVYGYPQGPGENYGRAKERESFENHIKSLQMQLDGAESRHNAMITMINNSHIGELERLKNHQESVALFYQTEFEILQKKYDDLETEYYTLQNEKSAALAVAEQAKADLESTKNDYFRQLKLEQEKHKFEIQKRDDTDKIQKKLDAQVVAQGLNDGNGIQGIIDGALRLFPILQAAGLFGGNTAVIPQQPPAIVHNPAQNLNGVQQVNSGPPPRPKPIPLPEQITSGGQVQ